MTWLTVFVTGATRRVPLVVQQQFILAEHLSTPTVVSGVNQGNPVENHKLWNIGSTERYILHMQELLEYCYM
jgi:hypothetical protein